MSRKYISDITREVRDWLCYASLAVTVASLTMLVPLHRDTEAWHKTAWALLGASGILVASHIERRGFFYSKVLRTYADVTDQNMIQGRWENRTEEELVIPYAPAADTSEDAPEGLKILTWTDFINRYVNNPERYPHFNIIGSTGDGKSLLAEVIGDKRAEYYASQGLDAQRIYVSPTVDTDEFRGWTLVGNEFQESEIADYGAYLDNELVRRYVDRADTHTPIITANDEARWSFKNTSLAHSINNTLAMGRKKRMEIINTNVTDFVKSQGMEGEGELRKNYVTILKGSHALDHVRQQAHEGMMPEGSVEFCERLFERFPQRFCVLVREHGVMLLPNLESYRPTKVHKRVAYRQPEPLVMPTLDVKPKEQPNRPTWGKRK